MANLAFERVVTVAELVECITAKEAALLMETHPKQPYDIAGKILPLLVARGIAFSPGKIGAKRCYGATSIIDPNNPRLPERTLSRRERVLEVVKEAVLTNKKALRVEELWKYVTQTNRLPDFTSEMFTHDVLSLLQTGELKRIRTVRGEGKGFNVYLPADFDEDIYTPTEPLSWLEEIAEAFDTVWNKHIAEAEMEGRKPLAVSTGEVRAQWLKMPNAHPKSKQTQPVVNGMGMLAENTQQSPARIRKIRRGDERALLWSPIGFTDEMLGCGVTYLSDFERIEVAVKRAVANTGRPVTLADINDEIDIDPSLHPAGKAKVRQVLMEAAKEFVGGGNQPRLNKKLQRVYRVGSLNNEAYYYHGNVGLTEAYTYVQSLKLESDWSELDFEARFSHLQFSPLPSIIFGNAEMLKFECSALLQQTKTLLEEDLDEHSKNQMLELLKAAIAAVAQVEAFIAENSSLIPPGLPAEVDLTIPGLTATELREVVAPLHRAIGPNTPREKVITLLWKQIRRFPNPNFKNRFDDDPQQAAEFLFDQTSALIYAGVTWGGPECAFQARTAQYELGRLRDARFVVPGLEDADQRNRLIAVACLAFLPGEIGSNELLHLVKEDKEGGVRQSALWAFCFRGEKCAGDLLNEVSRTDPNIHVRRFAQNALNQGDKGWWEL